MDGSHNAAIGLPVVGVSIAWAEGGEVQGAVVADVFSGATLGATREGPVRTRGPMAIGPPGRRSAVALQQAYVTPRASRALAAVRDQLEAEFPRVLSTWCPVYDLLLAARGHIVGWIAVGLGGPEYEAIRFLSRRIGLTDHQLDCRQHHIDDPHTFVVAWDSYTAQLVRAAKPVVIAGLA